MFKQIVAGALALGAATSANAVVLVDWTGGQVGPMAGQTLLRDFEGANGTAGIAGSNFGLYTGDNNPLAAAPFGNTSQYLAVTGGGSATITFDNPLEAFAIDIGSVDEYNTLVINFVGGGNQTFSGLALTNMPPANGDQSIEATNGRARFYSIDGQQIASITLSSTRNAFEVDNLSTAAVPEPATWGMMILGFGLLGASMRRRRTISSVLA